MRMMMSIDKAGGPHTNVLALRDVAVCLVSALDDVRTPLQLGGHLRVRVESAPDGWCDGHSSPDLNSTLLRNDFIRVESVVSIETGQANLAIVDSNESRECHISPNTVLTECHRGERDYDDRELSHDEHCGPMATEASKQYCCELDSDHIETASTGDDEHLGLDDVAHAPRLSMNVAADTLCTLRIERQHSHAVFGAGTSSEPAMDLADLRNQVRSSRD